MLPILLKTKWLVLYSYPFAMGLSWAFGYRFTEFFFHKNNLDSKNLPLFFLGLFGFSFLGAKLAYLLFSVNGMIDVYSQSLSFWLGGGFVFYGGFIFGGIWVYIASRLLNLLSKESIKYLVPGALLAHAIGRVGCFLAGCCYGQVIEGGQHFPIQLVESIAVAFLGVFILKKIRSKGIIFYYFLGYAFLRFIIEFFRGDEIRGFWPLGLSSSQVISLVIIILTLFYALIYKGKKK